MSNDELASSTTTGATGTSEDSNAMTLTMMIESANQINNNDNTPETEDDETDPARAALAANILADLIDDVTFGLILQTHRAAKLGYLQYVDPDSDSELDKQFEIYDDSDVLGVFKSANENSNKSSNKPQFG